jgi:hypothetical protein
MYGTSCGHAPGHTGNITHPFMPPSHLLEPVIHPLHHTQMALAIGSTAAAAAACPTPAAPRPRRPCTLLLLLWPLPLVASLMGGAARAAAGGAMGRQGAQRACGGLCCCLGT